LSGEHGDGLARSMFNERIFGKRIYDAFRAVKAAFDPENLMNPGKIVDAPNLTENLRSKPDYRLPVRPAFDFPEQLGILDVASRCNGNGLCRRSDVGTMCPSYMATLEERHSPRGRAN